MNITSLASNTYTNQKNSSQNQVGFQAAKFLPKLKDCGDECVLKLAKMAEIPEFKEGSR